MHRGAKRAQKNSDDSKRILFVAHHVGAKRVQKYSDDSKRVLFLLRTAWKRILMIQCGDPERTTVKSGSSGSHSDIG
jgi:hypothetical protein